MKTRINFLTLISFLAIIALVLFSCAKEELLPINPSKEVTAQSANDQAHEALTASTVPETDFLNQKIPGADLTFAEALEKIDPDPHPDWGVAVKSFTCIRSGETLLVYNPYNPSLDFYDSGRFDIYWFKDGRPLRDKEVRMECICRGKYAVVVLNKATKQGIGIGFQTIIHACPATTDAAANNTDI